MRSGRRRRRRTATRMVWQRTRKSGGHSPRRACCFSQAQSHSSGVELGSVGGETIHAKTAAVDGQGGTGQPGAVRVAAVPEQKQGRGNPAQQVTNKADHLEAGDGAGNQVEIGMGVGRDGGDGGQLGPVEAVTQDGRLSARRPGAAGRRQQREATLVHKNQRTLQPPGVFFIRGQGCSTQCRMAFSSRSRARPVGFCQLQPKPWSKRHTCSRS